MKKNLKNLTFGLLLVWGFVVPQTVSAQLMAVLQQDIGQQALYDLQHVDPQKRIVAMQIFLDRPQLLAPWIRLALGKAEHQPSHLKLLWLLGMTGNVNDVPKLLKLKPERENSYEFRIWKGAMQRLSQIQRGQSELGISIQEMTFTPYSQGNQQNSYKGQLTYQLSNELTEGRLIQVQMRVWYAKLEKKRPMFFLWLPKQGKLKQDLPVHLIFEPNQTQQPVNPTRQFRIDLSVGEVGYPENVVHQKLWKTVPF